MREKLIEVFNYVNSRYIFNAENYPIIAKLTPEERLVFSVQHSLLHMQKSLYDFLHIDDQAYGDKRLVSATKMLVNITKLADVVGMSKGDFAGIFQMDRPRPKEVFVELMGQVAAQCEKFDHGEDFSNQEVKYALIKMMNHFYSLTGSGNSKNLPYSLIEIIGNVPNVMKSK